ncbi:MAG: hypothetical protein IKR21_00065 [Oscillospiraceae bacterium]|nr:hypothetical protein [Oscillospiraceae bacterium]
MKKIFAAIFAALLLLSLAACAGQGGETDAPSPVKEPAAAPQSVDGPTPENETETEPTPEPPAAKTPEKPVPLALYKTVEVMDEWDDEYMLPLSYCRSSQLTLTEDEAERYPELAKKLSEVAESSKNALKNDSENLSDYSRSLIEGGSLEFYPGYSNMDVMARRADSTAICILCDDSEFYSHINGRWIRGDAYDPQTGEKIRLTDVITDMDSVPAIVEEELGSHMWTANFLSDTAVADYFGSRSEDAIDWSLDYNGVTFYFSPGDIADRGFGRASAMVSFEKFPELFNEKYTAVPDAFFSAFPQGGSIFWDLDGDGNVEEIILSAFSDEAVYDNADEGSKVYSGFGVYTDSDAYYCDELFAFSFHPYFVKTADEDYYLYVFCEGLQSGDREIMLKVLSLKDGKINEVGDMFAFPCYRADEQTGDAVFLVPTDPGEFYMDVFEDGTEDHITEEEEYPATSAYKVGADGMPEIIKK